MIVAAAAAAAVAAAFAAAVVGCAHSAVRPGQLAGTAPGGASPPPATAPPTPGPLVESARWAHTSQGYRLHVQPSRAGRRLAAAHVASTLAQSLRAAEPTPLHLTREVRGSLSDQLRCHAVFAQGKPLWNLEAWRPDVGYAATVLHACNP
jgi:hypothetical protein